MKEGKRFEQAIQDSCKKQELYCYRLPDGGGWSNADNTRFTPSNLSDFILHYDRYTIHLEAKTHKGKSIPVTAMKQVYKLAEINNKGVLALFILNFRDYNETYLIATQTLLKCLEYKKSVNIGFCRENGIMVKQTLKRVNYFYDIEKSLEEICIQDR